MEKENKVDANKDVTLLTQLTDENNDENVFLFSEEGHEIELEQIATISHNKNVYAILRPVNANDDEVVVFQLDPKDEESIVFVEDEKLAQQVLDIYHKEAGV